MPVNIPPMAGMIIHPAAPMAAGMVTNTILIPIIRNLKITAVKPEIAPTTPPSEVRNNCRFVSSLPIISNVRLLH